MPRARSIYRLKRIINGDIIDIRIWGIEKDEDYPEGIRYSMSYIKKTNNDYERIFGYDNEKGKGHHEHRYGKERKIEFNNWEDLVKRFFEEVDKIKKR